MKVRSSFLAMMLAFVCFFVATVNAIANPIVERATDQIEEEENDRKIDDPGLKHVALLGEDSENPYLVRVALSYNKPPTKIYVNYDIWSVNDPSPDFPMNPVGAKVMDMDNGEGYIFLVTLDLSEAYRQGWRPEKYELMLCVNYEGSLGVGGYAAQFSVNPRKLKKGYHLKSSALLLEMAYEELSEKDGEFHPTKKRNLALPRFE